MYISRLSDLNSFGLKCNFSQPGNGKEIKGLGSRGCIGGSSAAKVFSCKSPTEEKSCQCFPRVR